MSLAMPQTNNRSNIRPGFTLLEVLLTLSMSVVLMGLVGFAIQFYTEDMDKADQEARLLQLVTAVMQMIEDDLRSTIHPEPADMSALAAVLSSAAGGGGGGQGGGQGADDGSQVDDTEVSTGGTTDLATNSAVLQTPGLIGNQYQIQIDMSRLPRLEEYTQLLDATEEGLSEIPSNIKTVVWLVQPAGVSNGVSDELDSVNPDSGSTSDASTGGGLVRRSVARAASTYAASTGAVSELNQSGDLLAPEVTEITFEYWDGQNWQIEWSSDQMGELPLAVKINLSLTDPLAATDTATTADPRMFQHIVRLPMAKYVDTTDPSFAGAGI